LKGGPTPAVAVVQRYINTSHLTIHKTAPFDSTGADLLVMCASTHNDAILTPSDGFHNTWTSAAGPTNSNVGKNLRSQIWYAKNPAVGRQHTLTMALSTPQSLVISIFVVRDADVSNPIDALSAIRDDEGTQSLTAVSANITTASTNDLLIGFFKSALPEGWKSGSGYFLQPLASSEYLAGESGLAITPGSYNSTMILKNQSNWESAVLAIRPQADHPPSEQISLAWKASSDNVDVIGYEVQRCQGADCENFVKVGTPIEPFFVDSGLQPSVYRYRVRAYDAASNMSDYSDSITAHTTAITN
jgi:hypothetical protein